MANVIYPKWKEALMTTGAANIGLTSAAVVKAVLLDLGTYSYNAAHQYYSDLSGVVGTPTAIGSVTVTAGVMDGADVVFSAVTGATVEAIAIFIDTGVAATSRLVAYLDSGVTGLPVTPNGGSITCAFDNGANKIFAL